VRRRAVVHSSSSYLFLRFLKAWHTRMARRKLVHWVLNLNSSESHGTWSEYGELSREKGAHHE
jgi:hypothetical protein